jgi:hypothetical protein
MCAYPFRQTGSDTFLLSPAHAGGRRAQALLNEQATFALARRLHGEGAPLGEVFSFVSGLYFRGKLAYASRFGGAADQILVITTNRGLLPVGTMIRSDDLRALGTGDISLRDDTYRQALARDAARLEGSRIVFLGSIATRKYLEVLDDALGDRLVVPRAFHGLGDMSRGSILLEAARLGQELPYMPATESRIAQAQRSGRVAW